MKIKEEKKNKLKIPRGSSVERNSILVGRDRAIDHMTKLSS